MSIASEISRLQTAKADIRQAIIDKGVAVPAGDTIDQYPAYISLISGGGGGEQVARLTSYDPATGVLTGENFGTTQGAVYLLDRATHTEVSQPVSSWSNTSITLTTPLAVPYWSSSVYVVLPGNKCSNKIMVYNTTNRAADYGTLYYLDSNLTVQSISLTGTFSWNYTSYPEYDQTTIAVEGETIHTNEVLGVDFGPSWTTALPSQFFKNAQKLNQPVYHVASGYLNGGVMANCYAYNQPINFPNVTNTGQYTLTNMSSFNQPIELPELTNVNMGFMQYCYSFNQPISFPNATKLGQEFMMGCYAFNSPISAPEATEIGAYFLRACYSYNQDIYFPKVTTISQYFLGYNLYSFNGKVDLPELTEISGYFLHGGYNFNNTLALPKVTKVGNYFMNYCYSYNQPISLPLCTTIGADFLASCYKFNNTIDLPDVTSIGGNFLRQCTAFDNPLSLPSCTTIGEYFLRECDSFNSTLSLPVIDTIGNSFMNKTLSFDKDLDVSTATSIGSSFMNSGPGFTKTLKIGTSTMGTSFLRDTHACTVDVGNTPAPASAQNYSFSCSRNSCSAYVYGIRITGSTAAAWKAIYPDSTSPYRKLIVV